MSQDSVQLLPITITGTFIKIGDNLVDTSNDAVGTFDYHVKLTENTLFGPVFLTNPPVPAEVPGKVLNPTDTIFINFIKSMQASYNYKFTASQNLIGVQSEVEIAAILENPKVWSKTYILANSTSQERDFTINFPLDLKAYSAIGNSIQKETGGMAQTLNLTLQATVHTTGQSIAGPIDTTLVHTITTNLNVGLLTLNTALNKSAPGSIEITQPVNTKNKMLGLPVIGVRIASICLQVIAWILLGFYYLVFRRKNLATDLTAMQTHQTSRKYNNFIVEVTEWSEQGVGDSILTVGSLDELIKVSQALLKPINHVVHVNQDIYWLTEGSTRYEYRIIVVSH
jgi:hypothetical protein